MRGASFDHIERLVDGAADDGVEELERILATEEVEPHECRGGRTQLARLDAGESGRVAQLDPVAEDRGRAEERERLRLQPSKAKPDGPGNAVPSDLEQTWHVLGGRADSLPRDRVEDRDDEERVPSRRRFEGGGEGVVRRQAVQLARERGDRATPKWFGANRGGLGFGDELCDKRGSRPSPSGGRVAEATRSGTPSSRRVR